MKIIVQKFGGTSVASQEGRSRVVYWVSRARAEGFSPVVVVSAMGRAGDPYATDTLLGLAKQPACDASPRELDLLASAGEVISAVVMANALRAAGIECVALTGGQAGILTDSNFGNANILAVDPGAVLRHLKEEKVAVVAGFQGVTERGEITTLGRGGSDTTAAALGVALGAEVIEIYTDVDGVKTADPGLVPDARTIEVMTYDEVSQMAHEGAKVIHPRAVEIAMKKNIPIRVKSTFKDGPGTLITYSFETEQPWPAIRNGRPVTGVTHIGRVAQVKIRVPDSTDKGFNLRVFSSLARVGISVDMINVSPELICFIVNEDVAEKALQTLRGFSVEAEMLRDLAKVSVVGAGMRGLPGVMAAVVEALDRAGVEILQTSDSHVTISCLVKGENLAASVRALHDQFGLSRGE